MTTDPCPRCGGLTRQSFIILTMADGCHRIPGETICNDPECVEKRRKVDAEAAIARAIEAGVIDP